MTPDRASGDLGPGLLETSIVLGASLVLAFVIVFFFGGQLAALLGALVDIAHGGR
jgi:hypothetical protein